MSAPVIEHEAFCLDSLQKRLFFFDDFEGDQIKDEWTIVIDAACTATVMDGQPSGVLQLYSTNVANSRAYISWATFVSLLLSKNACFETYVKCSKVNAIGNDYGLSDATQGARFKLNGGSFFTRMNDGVQTDVLLVTVPDTNWHFFRVNTETTGGTHCHFYYDSLEVNDSPRTDRISANYLFPWVFSRTDENVELYTYADYVAARQDR